MKKAIFKKLDNFDDDFKNEILKEIDNGFNDNNEKYIMTDGEIMPVDENNFDCDEYNEIEKDFLDNINDEIGCAIESLSDQYDIQQTQARGRY